MAVSANVREQLPEIHDVTVLASGRYMHFGICLSSGTVRKEALRLVHTLSFLGEEALCNGHIRMCSA